MKGESFQQHWFAKIKFKKCLFGYSTENIKFKLNLVILEARSS